MDFTKEQLSELIYKHTKKRKRGTGTALSFKMQNYNYLSTHKIYIDSITNPIYKKQYFISVSICISTVYSERTYSFLRVGPQLPVNGFTAGCVQVCTRPEFFQMSFTKGVLQGLDSYARMVSRDLTTLSVRRFTAPSSKDAPLT